MKALVVDDSAAVRDILASHLARLGFDVDAAAPWVAEAPAAASSFGSSAWASRNGARRFTASMRSKLSSLLSCSNTVSVSMAAAFTAQSRRPN